jgi:hypothetical protein
MRAGVGDPRLLLRGQLAIHAVLEGSLHLLRVRLEAIEFRRRLSRRVALGHRRRQQVSLRRRELLGGVALAQARKANAHRQRKLWSIGEVVDPLPGVCVALAIGANERHRALQ